MRVSMDTALPADHISPASDIHPLHLRLSIVRGRAQRVLLLLATSRRLHLLNAFPARRIVGRPIGRRATRDVLEIFGIIPE